jgi:hypothetical protein
MKNTDDEFFIGWNPMPPNTRVTLMKSLWILFFIVLVTAVAGSALQRTIGTASFEYETVRDFEGYFHNDPVPMLVVDRSGQSGHENPRSRYLLVHPFKFGFSKRSASQHNGQFISLRGKLIYRGQDTMIEVIPDSIKPIPTAAAHQGDTPFMDGGEVSLRGEIVDSKCYYGVMNPGDWKPHRACAIRCISGGIPPVLHVKMSTGQSRTFVLASASGESILEAILPLVALPVEVSGQLRMLGDLSILYILPESIRSL